MPNHLFAINTKTSSPSVLNVEGLLVTTNGPHHFGGRQKMVDALEALEQMQRAVLESQEKEE